LVAISLEPALPCVQARRPVERRSQMTKQICNLEQVPVTGFQHKVQHYFTLVLSGMKCNISFPPKQTLTETMTGTNYNSLLIIPC